MKLNKTLARMRVLVTPYMSRVLAATVFSLVVSGINGAIAWFVKPAMDYIFVQHQHQYIYLFPVAVFLLYIFRGAADMVQTYLMQTAAFKMTRDMRNSFFENIVGLPVSDLSATSSGDMVSRLISDITILSRILSDSLKVFLAQIPSLIVLAGIALYRRWDLTVLSFILLPFIAWTTRVMSKFMRKKRREVQRLMSVITHRMNEMITGIKVIKIFGMEETKTRQFVNENQDCYRQNARLVRLKEGSQFVIDIISGLAISIILGYGSWLVTHDQMTSGDFFSILAAIVMAFAPLKKLGSAYSTFQEAVAVLERVDAFLVLPTEKTGQKGVDGIKKGIEFNGVSFNYQPDHSILADINLFVPKGRATAIVGHSGGGKSTLVDLIPRFITPKTGKILWDDEDLEMLDIARLRQNIGIVSQDIILFSDTIRENIAYGKPNATHEEVEEAARLADAHDFIALMPDGYETRLTERGLNLSGGQRQRIALARAILKNPPLLILDEATSALDTVSEQAVQKAIAKAMTGRTTIIIAHRLSTIQHADQIVVMENGRIVAIGTHSKLLETNPIYRELYQTWATKER